MAVPKRFVKKKILKSTKIKYKFLQKMKPIKVNIHLRKI
jgi:hypothetical protein